MTPKSSPSTKIQTKIEKDMNFVALSMPDLFLGIHCERLELWRQKMVTLDPKGVWWGLRVGV
jgi:hypothetical protein